MEEFSIFNIFTLLGGLAFFLYGMKVMSTGLEKLTGGKLTDEGLTDITLQYEAEGPHLIVPGKENNDEEPHLIL